MVVASLVVPALLFLYAGFANHDAIRRHHEQRLLSALDVVEEHASKALQTIALTVSETNEVLRDLSDEAIRAEEARLHARLRKTQAPLAQIQAIWAFDRLGHPLVSSTVLPVPRGLDNTDRDYFRAQAETDAGTYVGEVVNSKVGNHRFFVVSQRRPSPDARFNGIIAVSVFPEHFREFYARMAGGIADSFGLVRPDGVFLVRYPSRDEPMRLNAQSQFVQAVRTEPEFGLFTAVSQIDGIERRIRYRKVPDYPVYVQVGMETGAVWRELRSIMLGHLVFGVPATLLLFGLSLYALRRTRAFQGEVGRREMAEAALKQAQRLEAIGQLTGGVAHDFNNLLMVVKGNAERLRRSATEERQKRSLDAIESAAERGASLTRQLLSFSRKQTHESAVVDLAQLLPELQDMLRSSLRGDIGVALRVAEELWPIKVDLSEFELAILNIAVNARDAMPQGGQLTMAAQNVALADPAIIGRPGEFVALSISDTGSGIPPDVLPRVFEPFFTTKEVGKGTGLGLSQVYGFARQSEGAATVASEPGRGTTITLYLPRTLDALEPKAGEERAVPSRDGRGSILLVEDNAAVTEITKANLEEVGYRVTQAATAAEALRALKTDKRFDVLFSDIVMPGETNGLDLARAVREERPELAVLLATGYSVVAQTAVDEGFLVLRKPYDTQTLVEALRGAIRSKRFKVVA